MFSVGQRVWHRDGKRSGGDTIMAAALYGVSDADIKALVETGLATGASASYDSETAGVGTAAVMLG